MKDLVVRYHSNITLVIQTHTLATISLLMTNLELRMFTMFNEEISLSIHNHNRTTTINNHNMVVTMIKEEILMYGIHQHPQSRGNNMVVEDNQVEWVWVWHHQWVTGVVIKIEEGQSHHLNKGNRQ